MLSTGEQTVDYDRCKSYPQQLFKSAVNSLAGKITKVIQMPCDKNETQHVEGLDKSLATSSIVTSIPKYLRRLSKP